MTSFSAPPDFDFSVDFRPLFNAVLGLWLSATGQYVCGAARCLGPARGCVRTFEGRDALLAGLEAVADLDGVLSWLRGIDHLSRGWGEGRHLGVLVSHELRK